MLLLNLKQSFRNLKRNKIYTAVNLAGLSVSGAFILLVAVYITHALKMDKYSSALNSIYRIETSSILWREPDTTKKKGLFDWLAKDAEVQNQLVTPFVTGEDLKQNFPEIQQYCRIRSSESVITIGNKKFKEDESHIVYTDKNFFSFFDLPLLTTNKKNAFSNVHSVVLSERAAKKYFGKENPIGKIISIKWDNSLYAVSAVAKNFPANSSMQFDLMFCLEGIDDYTERMQSGLGHSSVLTLIQLKEGTDVSAFKKKLANFGESYFKEWVDLGKKIHPETKSLQVNLSIRPFSESHYNVSSGWFYFTDVKSLYQLVLLALIALGIACLNYVLLSLSRVAIRSHEAGVRRTVGAGWKHMMSLFLTETWLLVLLSMLSGFVLAVIALPYFNELTKVDISITEILNPQFIVVAFLLVLLLTFIAGIYPAIKMAGIKPLNVLNKFGTYKLNPTLSKVFITLQYTACIVLIVFSIVIARQMRFVNNKDLGFDKEQTILIQNPYWGDRENTLSLREKLRNFASSQSSIVGVTGSTFRYGTGGEWNGHIINGIKTMINSKIVDYDYFEYNKIPIVRGRSFSKEFSTDTSRLNIPKERLDSTSSKTYSNLVVNETLYNMLGQPPLNELSRPLAGYIVGVCKDYFFMGLDQKIGPAYHRCRPDRLGFFWFRIAKGQDLAANISKLKSEFNKDTNGEDFSYYFMDEDVKNLYESHQRWLKIISFASWMAIFIACLGLFGLSAIVAVNRTKEIGIRKVLGASVTQLFYTLNKQSLVIVFVSILIAVPIANYVSNNWLENFAYRIQMNWMFFVVAAFIGFACALISVSYHTLKVANSNPVESLRTE